MQKSHEVMLPREKYKPQRLEQPTVQLYLETDVKTLSLSKPSGKKVS